VSAALEIQLVAIVAAVACALPGTFLVLRRTALLADAISHSILLGIVLAFLLVRDLASPLLVIGAALTGLLTVALVELLQRSGRVREDAAIGLVFPLLFSVAVILVSRHAANIHLDADAVLLGELALAPFRRVVVAGADLGPRSLWVLGTILVVSVLFLLALFKELKLTSFDPELAAALGISPVVVHYALMGLVSVTAVGAFDAVGAVLVVALMIAPPSAAWLLSDRLPVVLILSAALAALAALVGFRIAWWADASIAGSMAGVAGLIFLLAFLFAPGRGWVAGRMREQRQRVEFAGAMLAIHLLNHEGDADRDTVCTVEHLQEHLRWTDPFARVVVRRVRREGWIDSGESPLRLTPEGQRAARDAMTL
jgi:manganese/zinc/iron transport system permease protein